MDTDKLKARKAQLEQERENIKVQFDRMTGAILILEELIAAEAQAEASPAPETVSTGGA